MEICTVLDLIKQKIESLNPVPEAYLVSKGSYNGFEKLVPVVANELANELVSDDLKVITHMGHHFPDLDLILNGSRYGIELKSRNNGSWDTNGNSVFESISNLEYDDIFVFFGSRTKGTSQFKVKFAPYWEVTSNIVVTHSPRFKINMNTSTSVFSSKQEYSLLRSYTEKEKITFLQKFLKENTTGVKWFVPQDNDAVKPISLNTLDSKIQNQVTAEVFVLFPQDLLHTTSKGTIRSDYGRSAEYLIMTYFYYSSSFRDFFSAGGQWEYNDIKFPQVIQKIFQLKNEIQSILSTANDEFKKIAYESWEELGLNVTKTNFADDYETILKHLGRNNFSDLLKESKVDHLSDFIL